MNPTDLIQFLLEAANQIRVLHWGTSSYSEHVALGDLYDAISDSTDKIAEALMGAPPRRIQLKGSLELVDYAKGMPASYVAGLGKALESITGLPTDILNTRDDLLGAVHKASYLLTLSAGKTEAAEGVPQGMAESAHATLPPAQGPEMAQPSVVDSAAECRSRHSCRNSLVTHGRPWRVEAICARAVSLGREANSFST